MRKFSGCCYVERDDGDFAATFPSPAFAQLARFSQRVGKRGESRARARALTRPPRIRTLVSLKSLDREKRLLHGFWHLRAHPPRRAARQPRALSFLLPLPLAMFKLNKVSTVSFPLAIEYIEIPSSTEKVFLSTGKEERSRNLSVSPTALQSR